MAPSALAFDTELRLDPVSFIQQTGPRRTAVYTFPEAARLRLSFGQRKGNSIPVTIPVDGLLLGLAQADGMPPLEFRLAEAAHGDLQIGPGGDAVLTLAAAVLVQPLGALRAVRYDLTLSVEVVRMGTTTKGWMQMAAADAVKGVEGRSKERFTALIGGTLASLPPDF
jgi:hypothetical protein